MTPGEDLESILCRHEVRRVDVCGIATDYCVRAIALDAARRGFDVRVLPELCAGVAPETTAVALAELDAAGVEIAATTSTGAGFSCASALCA